MDTHDGPGSPPPPTRRDSPSPSHPRPGTLAQPPSSSHPRPPIGRESPSLSFRYPNPQTVRTKKKGKKKFELGFTLSLWTKKERDPTEENGDTGTRRRRIGRPRSQRSPLYPTVPPNPSTAPDPDRTQDRDTISLTSTNSCEETPVTVRRDGVGREASQSHIKSSPILVSPRQIRTRKRRPVTHSGSWKVPPTLRRVPDGLGTRTSPPLPHSRTEGGWDPSHLRPRRE